MSERKIIVIIPAYNEEDSIVSTYKKLQDLNEQVDYVIINDGSTDKTAEIIEENNLSCIPLVANLGIGGAVQTGYKYAFENNYDIAIQFDGDGQHDASYIKNIISPIISDEVDMVVGSRFIEGKESSFQSSKARRIGINLISFIIKIATGKKIYDTTSGFRAVNKKVIAEFAHNYPVEYPEPVSTVYLLKKGYRVSEIPVEMNERIAGTSSISTWKSVYYMVNVILSIIIYSLRRYK